RPWDSDPRSALGPAGPAGAAAPHRDRSRNGQGAGRGSRAVACELMDPRLLQYYNIELQHLREMGAEFAEQFPKIAARLGMSGLEVTDPYVERLIEGVSFLAARVHLKLDAEFPRFTQNLLETVYPHYLAPTPSMCVVQFQPQLDDPTLGDGAPIPRDSKIRGMLARGEQTACEYRTAHDLTLWPVRIVEAGYFTRDLASLEI